MTLAPSSIARMSMPCKAAGKSPTAESSEVRPPTQSDIGNVVIQPSDLANLSSWLSTPVMAIACLAKSSFWAAKAF